MVYYLIVLIFIKIIRLIERFGSQFYLRKHIHSLTIGDENSVKTRWNTRLIFYHYYFQKHTSTKRKIELRDRCAISLYQLKINHFAHCPTHRSAIRPTALKTTTNKQTKSLRACWKKPRMLTSGRRTNYPGVLVIQKNLNHSIEHEINRGYHRVARRYKVSLRVLKNTNCWNIFQHEKRTFCISKRLCKVLFIKTLMKYQTISL